MLCLFLLLVQTNAVMFQHVEAHIQNNTGAPKKKQFLGSILSDPKKFVEEATNLDPVAVVEIIKLLDVLLVTSVETEKDLSDTLDIKTAESIETGIALSRAGDAVGIAEGVVKVAEGVLKDAKDTVDTKKEMLKAKKILLEAAKDAHTTQIEVTQASQDKLDKEKPDLDKEQVTLKDVKGMLGSVTDGALFSCEAGQGSHGPKLSENTDNSKEKCEHHCRSTDGCIAFDYTTEDISNACRLYSSIGHSRTDPGVHGRQFCVWKHRGYKMIKMANQDGQKMCADRDTTDKGCDLSCCQQQCLDNVDCTHITWFSDINCRMSFTGCKVWAQGYSSLTQWIYKKEA